MNSWTQNVTIIKARGDSGQGNSDSSVNQRRWRKTVKSLAATYFTRISFNPSGRSLHNVSFDLDFGCVNDCSPKSFSSCFPFLFFCLIFITRLLNLFAVKLYPILFPSLESKLVSFHCKLRSELDSNKNNKVSRVSLHYVLCGC